MTWERGYRRPGDRSSRPHVSLREFLPHLLRQVTRSVDRAVAVALADHGADWTTVAVLVPLQRFEQLPQTVLVDRADVDRNTISVLLAELEYEGLVVRERDPNDLRRLRVRGTEALGDVVAELRKSVHSAEEEALSRLDRAERERLRELLQRSLPPGYTGVMGLRF